jgi:16S rRNA (uracil1498-N3)-methyltransferase
MPSPRFYVPDALASESTIELTAEQARQLRTVLRLRPGDALTLFDGSGREAGATLTQLTGTSATASVISVTRPLREPGLRLTIGLALIKPAAFELAVQKLTELGLARIVPLITDRAVVSYRDARDWERRAVRLERILREAAEQAERVTLPELAAPMRLPDLLDRQPVVALVERSDAEPLRRIPFVADTALAIGPEGGWSPAERVLLEQRAWAAASLGNLILRAETAAIAAATIILHESYPGEHTL